MIIPKEPKIYHIVHVNRLPSIIEDGYLWCDAEVIKRDPPGSVIGMNKIKERRLNELCVSCHPDLKVGSCVPFYFCPRSVMLFMLARGNHPDVTFRDGQELIVHLEVDMYEAVSWAEQNNVRWAFTTSNAGAFYTESYCSLENLDRINWEAVADLKWGGNNVPRSIKEGKQAEFLVANSFPWALVSRVGVFSPQAHHEVSTALRGFNKKPLIEIKKDWYY